MHRLQASLRETPLCTSYLITLFVLKLPNSPCTRNVWWSLTSDDLFILPPQLLKAGRFCLGSTLTRRDWRLTTRLPAFCWLSIIFKRRSQRQLRGNHEGKMLHNKDVPKGGGGCFIVRGCLMDQLLTCCMCVCVCVFVLLLLLLHNLAANPIYRHTLYPLFITSALFHNSNTPET